MTVFAVGSSSKQWPALLDLLERVGFTPTPLDQHAKVTLKEAKKSSVRAAANVKKSRSKTQSKPKAEIANNKIFYSEPHAPLAVFSEILKENKNCRTIVFYQSAELFLAEAMAGSLSPDEAVFTWKMNTNETLAFFKRSRKQVILIESNEALCTPNAFLTFCVNKFRFNGADNIKNTYTLQPTPNLYRLLAQEILNQNSDIQALQDELYASSVQLSKSRQSIGPDVTDLYEEHKNMSELVEKNALTIKHLEAENDLITKKMNTLEKTVCDLESSLKVNFEHMAEQQHESESIYIELQTQKEKLNEYKNREQWREAKVKREMNRLKTDIKEHSNAVEAMQTSRSWRLTSPLRKVGRKISAVRTRDRNFKTQVEAVKASTLFNAEWYGKKYPDINAKKIDFATHYVRYGALEGRSPGPDFNTREYLNKNPDVRSTGVNPLIHFIQSQQNLSETDS